MKVLFRQIATILPILVTLTSASAFAGPIVEGGANGGGGDRCEERFKSVARDLNVWILDRGHFGLDLTRAKVKITTDDYAAGILKAIAQARVTCVGPGDVGYPVMYNGKPKECKAGQDAKGVWRVICDRQKFYASLAQPENDPSQYRIVHHEYATLAGIEVPNEDDSDYSLSDQLSGFLENQIVKRLVVRRSISFGNDAQSAFKNLEEQEKQLRRMGKQVQIEKLNKQAMALFQEKNAIDLSQAEWIEKDRNPERFIDAQRITYVRNKEGLPCEISLTLYSKSRQYCPALVGLFTLGYGCFYTSPFPKGDTYEGDNASGSRIAVVSGYCKTQGARDSWLKSMSSNPEWPIEHSMTDQVSAYLKAD